MRGRVFGADAWRPAPVPESTRRRDGGGQQPAGVYGPHLLQELRRAGPRGPRRVIPDQHSSNLIDSFRNV